MVSSRRRSRTELVPGAGRSQRFEDEVQKITILQDTNRGRHRGYSNHILYIIMAGPVSHTMVKKVIVDGGDSAPSRVLRVAVGAEEGSPANGASRSLRAYLEGPEESASP